MSNLLCPKCLKYILGLGTVAPTTGLFCNCPSSEVWTISLTLTNGTVYTGKAGNPFKRTEVPPVFREAFKDGELELP